MQIALTLCVRLRMFLALGLVLWGSQVGARQSACALLVSAYNGGLVNLRVTTDTHMPERTLTTPPHGCTRRSVQWPSEQGC